MPEREGASTNDNLPASAGGTAILEKIADPSGVYQYRMFAGSGREALETFLNEAGSQGYSILPRSVTPSWLTSRRGMVVWLEKPSGPSPSHEFVVLDWGMGRALKAGFNPRYWLSINPLDYLDTAIEKSATQGYRITRMIPLAVLILDRSGPPPEAAANSPGTTQASTKPRRYRTLGQLGAAKLERQLADAVGHGYRLSDLVPDPITPWPAVLLELDPGAPQSAGPTREYHVMESPDLRALEHLANEAGARGFRLRPESLSAFKPLPSVRAHKPRAVMEQLPGSTATYQYRFLTAPALPELARRLNDAAHQGYQLVGMVDAQTVILEGPVPPAARKD